MATLSVFISAVYLIESLSSTNIVCSDNECTDSIIECTSDELCNIECNENGCYNSEIYCSLNNECIVTCNGRNSCSFSTIHAEESSMFELNLLAHDSNTYTTANIVGFIDMTVYFPSISQSISQSHLQKNIIRSSYHYQQHLIVTNPTFYSINKFEDIEVFNVSFTNGVMHYSTDFVNKCEFEFELKHTSSMYCKDVAVSTSTPSTTFIPVTNVDNIPKETVTDEIGTNSNSGLLQLTKYDILLIICISLSFMVCCVCCLFGFYILGSQHTISRLASIQKQELPPKTELAATIPSGSNIDDQQSNEEIAILFGHGQNSNEHRDETDTPLELNVPPPSEYTNPMPFNEYEEYIKNHFLSLQKQHTHQSDQTQPSHCTNTSELLFAPVPSPHQPPMHCNKLQPLQKRDLDHDLLDSSSDEENIFIRGRYGIDDNKPNSKSQSTPNHKSTANHYRSTNLSVIDRDSDLSQVVIKISHDDSAGIGNANNENEHSLEVDNNITFREGNSSSMDSVTCDHDKPDADVWSSTDKNSSENRDTFGIVTTPWKWRGENNLVSPVNLHPHIYEKSMIRPKLHDLPSGASASSVPTIPASHNRGETEEKLDVIDVQMKPTPAGDGAIKFSTSNLSPVPIKIQNKISISPDSGYLDQEPSALPQHHVCHNDNGTTSSPEY